MMTWVIVGLLCVANICQGVLIVLHLKTIDKSVWLEEVLIPWMVSISKLLHDDTNPPQPPPIKG